MSEMNKGDTAKKDLDRRKGKGQQWQHVKKNNKKRDKYKPQKKPFTGPTSEKFNNKVKYDYMKLLRKERKNKEHEPKPTRDIVQDSNEEAEVSSPSKKKLKTFKPGDEGSKEHTFAKAQRDFKKKADIKEQDKQDTEKRMKESKKALDSYKDRKKKRHMMLNKKTRKGQPIMKYQMEYLLEKIQDQVGKS